MTKIDQNLIRESIGQGQQSCQNWKKSKICSKVIASAAPAPAYEPVQKHEVTPVYRGDLISNMYIKSYMLHIWYYREHWCNKTVSIQGTKVNDYWGL